MVQPGAKAIVVYPISPTALNEAVKAACDKGVVVVAYDGVIEEPCAYNVHVDQYEWGKLTAAVARRQARRQGQRRHDHGRRRDIGRHAAQQGGARSVREVSRISRSSPTPTACGARRSRGPNCPRSSRRIPWDTIDGLWMQAGCYTAFSMQSEVRHRRRQAQALRRRRLERTPHPDAAGVDQGRRRQRHLSSDGRAEHVGLVAGYSGRDGAQDGGRQARRQERGES